MSRVLVKISSVLKVRISSGRSSHVSSAGISGVSSIATPSVDIDVVRADESGFLSESDGGVIGGGADDILEVGRSCSDALNKGHAYAITPDLNRDKYGLRHVRICTSTFCRR